MLLVGLNGLGNEVCKNILLAGVHHLTLLDHTTLTKEDVENQFLSEKSEVGKNVSLFCKPANISCSKLTIETLQRDRKNI